jgi:hypothetical protein
MPPRSLTRASSLDSAPHSAAGATVAAARPTHSVPLLASW